MYPGAVGPQPTLCLVPNLLGWVGLRRPATHRLQLTSTNSHTYSASIEWYYDSAHLCIIEPEGTAENFTDLLERLKVVVNRMAISAGIHGILQALAIAGPFWGVAPSASVETGL